MESKKFKNSRFFLPDRPFGRAVALSSLEWEVRSSNLGPVKSDTVLLITACHRCDISSKGAVLPGGNDAQMDPGNSLHASACYSEYNETLDLIMKHMILRKKFTSAISAKRTFALLLAFLRRSLFEIII